MSEIAWWQGDHGDEYTERNDAYGSFWARAKLWQEILECLQDAPRLSEGGFTGSILEIGAGSGGNMHPLLHLGYYPLIGVEPNAVARAELEKEEAFRIYDGTAAKPGTTAELVFTSGVLIHIPPDELLAACQGIYDAAKKYIVCIEYFSAELEEKPYRGRKLWKRDFGDYWMDNFDLKPLGCGFAWKRTTGLDNLTWWAFERCN